MYSSLKSTIRSGSHIFCGPNKPIQPRHFTSFHLGTASNLSSRLGASAQDSFEGADDEEERRLAHALLVCFMAAQNKSLFAAKCLVETIIQIYRRGYTLDDIKLAVTIATLTTADPLKPLMLDILLAWTAVVMMTLKSVGVPFLPGAEARFNRRSSAEQEEQEDRMSQGLEFFVKSCIDRFLSGTDLFRLQLQQSMQPGHEGDPAAAGESPTVAVLQQNTRLSIITLTVVRDMGLPTKIPLKQSIGADGSDAEAEEEEEDGPQSPISGAAMSEYGPIGYVEGFLDDSKAPRPGLTGEARATAVRLAAIRLLVAFNGAVLGYLRAAKAFVNEAYECYTAGWSVDELFSSLQDDEFAQSGGVTRFNLANSPEGRHISALLFARWLSLCFMALVQLGAQHPEAMEKTGWAWVSTLSGGSGVDSGAVEAHAISDFVSSTLRIATMSDEESGGDEEARSAGGRRGIRDIHENLPQSVRDSMDEVEAVSDSDTPGFNPSSMAFEDPGLLQTSSFALILSQEISLVRLTRLVMLQKRGMAAYQAAATET